MYKDTLERVKQADSYLTYAEVAFELAKIVIDDEATFKRAQ